MKQEKKKKLSPAQFKQFIPLYIMMIPGLLYLLINNYIPMTGIIVAFKKYNLTTVFTAVRGTDSKTLNIC